MSNEEAEGENEEEVVTEEQTESCSKVVLKCLNKPIQLKEDKELKQELSLLIKYSDNNEYHTIFFNFIFLLSVAVLSFILWIVMLEATIDMLIYIAGFLFGFNIFLSITERLRFEEKIALSERNKKAFYRNLENFDSKIGEIRFRIACNWILYTLVLPLTSSKSPIVAASLAQPLKSMYIKELKENRKIKIPEKFDVTVKPIDEEETCEAFQIIKRNVIKFGKGFIKEIKEEF